MQGMPSLLYALLIDLVSLFFFKIQLEDHLYFQAFQHYSILPILWATRYSVQKSIIVPSSLYVCPTSLSSRIRVIFDSLYPSVSTGSGIYYPNDSYWVSLGLGVEVW